MNLADTLAVQFHYTHWIVNESLKGITKLVIRSLQQRHEAESDAEQQAEQAVEAVSSQVLG